MSFTFTTTLERDRRVREDDVTDEISVEVTYDYSRGCRGARDSLGGVRGAGPPLEPDEPPSVEIISVMDADGNDYDLTNNERERIEEECFQDHQDGYEADQEARA